MRQPTIKSQFLDEVPEANCTRSDLGDGWADYRDEGDDDRRIEYLTTLKTEIRLSSAFRAGTVVRHQQFGTGVIASFSHRGKVHSVVVDFKAVGRKTLVLEYAKLQRIDF